MECPDCAGAGCESCSDRGVWEIRQCPQRLITRDVHWALEFAAYAEKGSWPLPGGVLAQTRWVLDAFRRIWRDTEAMRPARL